MPTRNTTDATHLSTTVSWDDSQAVTRFEKYFSSPSFSVSEARKPWPLERVSATLRASMHGLNKYRSLDLIKDRNSKSFHPLIGENTIKRSINRSLWITEIARNSSQASKRQDDPQVIALCLFETMAHRDWEALNAIIHHMDNDTVSEAMERMTAQELSDSLILSLQYENQDLFRFLVSNASTKKLTDGFIDDQVINLLREGSKWPEEMVTFLRIIKVHSRKETSLIYKACQKRENPAVLRMLLQSGLDPECRCPRWNTRGLQNLFFIPESLTLRPRSHYAIKFNQALVKKAELLLSHGADINLQNDRGTTALIEAVKCRADRHELPFDKEAPAVDFLLQKGAKMALQDHSGRDARWYASHHSWEEESPYDTLRFLLPYTEFTGHPAAEQALKNRSKQEAIFLKSLESESNYPFYQHLNGKKALSIEEIKALPSFLNRVQPRNDWQDFQLFLDAQLPNGYETTLRQGRCNNLGGHSFI